MLDRAKCSKCGQTIPLVMTSKGWVLSNHTTFVSYTKRAKCPGSGEVIKGA